MVFEETLKDLDFPNYEGFNDIEIACSYFIERLTKIIDRIAPIKQSKITPRICWEITEKIAIRENAVVA